MDSKLMLTIIQELIARDSLDSFESVVPGKGLYKDQILVTVLALLKKKLIITFDTGFGKTVVASALANLTVTPETRGLFILKRTTLDELTKKLRSMLTDNVKLGYITNESSVIYNMIVKGLANTCNFLVLSSDCLSNSHVNDYLFNIRDNLKIVIVDEMHLFANLQSAESRLMYYLIKKAEYSYALTATPFERDIEQLINTVYCFTPSLFGTQSPRTVSNKFKRFENGKFVGYKNIQQLKQIIAPVMCNKSRNGEGKHCYIHRVEPQSTWKEVRPIDAVAAIKGDVTADPFKILVSILDDYTEQGLRGIVYANLNKVKKPIYERLKALGFRVGIVDGTVSVKSEREITKQQFNAGNYDVLITNKAESADLECSYVIFYELTQKYYQVVGRSRRSREKKDTFIHIIYAKNTYEERYFIQKMYPRLKALGQLCGKDVSELQDEVEKYV